MDKGQKEEYVEGIEEYLEEYNVYDYFYELMKEVVTQKPKNPVDFLIERISKSETKRCVMIGPPGFSQLGLGRLIAGKIGWKYLSMTDWIERDIDEIRKQEAESLPKPRPEKKPKPETKEVKEEKKEAKEETKKVEAEKKDEKKEDDKKSEKKEDDKKEEDKKDEKKETEEKSKDEKDKDDKDKKKDDEKEKEKDKEKEKEKSVKDENKDDEKSQADEKASKASIKNEAEGEGEGNKEEGEGAEGDQESPPEVEEPEPEAPPPPKTHILELQENLIKFRDEITSPNEDTDLNNSHLFDDIIIRNQETIKAAFISDKNSIKVFSKNAKEYSHESWILEGFPKTKSQALALSKNKAIPDRIFLLKYSDSVAKEHVLEGLRNKHGEDYSEEQLEEVADRVLDEYHLNIKEVEDMFKNVIHVIDAHGYVQGYTDDTNKASHFVDQISTLITMKRMSPDRRLRVIITGAPGSGRSTQAERIAKKYGLIHVSTSNLLKNEIRLKTEKGKRIKECFSNNKLVPDEIICSLIESRIRHSDCKLNGWVLDGFPKTIQQITVLKAMKIKPTRVIVLECDKEICCNRILNRHFDPVTGNVYNIVDNPPKDQEVEERLVPYFADMTKEKVEKRWNLWNQFQLKVEESYQELALKFNTEEYTVEQVTNQVCEFLQNPLF